MKMVEISSSSLYQKGLSKIYSTEIVRLLEIPLKKDRNW